MKYPVPSQSIPSHRRADVNAKILLLLESGNLQGLSAADVFAAYTGDGGLHGLQRADYDNFYEYTKAKKSIEQGQFFTPSDICGRVVGLLGIEPTDLVADLSCGSGNFFNVLPNEANTFGCEIDTKAVKVARFLYPQAHIENTDLRFYQPGIFFDFIVGNPPFNLRWKFQGEEQSSNLVYLKRTAELLSPGGLTAVIVPEAFLSDPFMENATLSYLNENFSFIGQARLAKDSFRAMGVQSFPTKVVFLQRCVDQVEKRPFQTEEYSPLDGEQLAARLQAALQIRKQHRITIRKSLSCRMEENNYSVKNIQQRPNTGFSFLLRKLLFEIGVHPASRILLGRANQLVDKFHTQKRPDEVTPEEWEKIKLTENKVLASLRRLLREALNPKPKRAGLCAQLVNGGFRILAGDSDARKLKDHHRLPDFISFTDIHTGRVSAKGVLAGLLAPYTRMLRARQTRYNLQVADLAGMKRQNSIDKALNSFRFIGTDGLSYGLYEKQIEDIGLIAQKPQGGILNWSQGSGKTPACFALYQLLGKNYRNTVLLAPPIAHTMTWIPFLTRQGASFREVRTIEDIAQIQPGELLLTPTSLSKKLARQMRTYMRTIGYRALVIFDESDEISNNHSGRSVAIRHTFRKCPTKFLATGTVTRNNLSELYPQLDLLFNGSAAFEDRCPIVFREERSKEDGLRIRSIDNKFRGTPFAGRNGFSRFKSCFSPSRSTVFGIGKQTQDIYNPSHLEVLLGCTVLTRKFREMAGPDRFEIHTHTVSQPDWEREFYAKILTEFSSLIPAYFRSTGSGRKDSMLRLVRQLRLLIKSCSVPHLLTGRTDLPEKAVKITDMVRGRGEKRVMVGATSKKAARFYHRHLSDSFPGRPIFLVMGDVEFTERKSIIAQFEKTDNGILVCTQQSLSSSVDIPFLDEVILESLQFNLARMEQFYFRAIRFNSRAKVNVHFVIYQDSIEVNLMTLLLDKERLNDFIKTRQLRSIDQVMGDFKLDSAFLDMLLEKSMEEGKTVVKWGKQRLVAA